MYTDKIKQRSNRTMSATSVFGRGCGSDQIQEVGELLASKPTGREEAPNTARFTANLSVADIQQETGTNNLIMSMNSTSDQLRIIDPCV